MIAVAFFDPARLTGWAVWFVRGPADPVRLHDHGTGEAGPGELDADEAMVACFGAVRRLSPERVWICVEQPYIPRSKRDRPAGESEGHAAASLKTAERKGWIRGCARIVFPGRIEWNPTPGQWGAPLAIGKHVRDPQAPKGKRPPTTAERKDRAFEWAVSTVKAEGTRPGVAGILRRGGKPNGARLYDEADAICGGYVAALRCRSQTRRR